MTCSGCESIVSKALSRVEGIKILRISHITGQLVMEISNDQDIAEIKAVIESEGYYIDELEAPPVTKKEGNPIGWIMILLAGFLIINNTVGFNYIPEIPSNISFLALFLIGLVTSLHCIAMCGGIVISQCVQIQGTKKTYMPAVLYNLGRIVSYTVIGGIVGGIGASVQFSGGLIPVFAGIFMTLMGINMLVDNKIIKRLIPKIPGSIRAKNAAKQGKSPFVVGLLNGLMPCGPLQSMQLYALGTGSVVEGAASMFFFSAGTVPLMLGIGVLSGKISSKMNRRMMHVGAALVIFMGIAMLSRGLALSGIDPISYGSTKQEAVLAIENNTGTANNEQYVETILSPRGYPVITVKKGVPVKWNFIASEETLNGCNNEIIIPEYNINIKLLPGDNFIEFTPTEAGVVGYSCWMGMIRSQINVVEDTGSDSPVPALQPENVVPPTSGGADCCSGGTQGIRTQDPVLVNKAIIIDGVQVMEIHVDAYGYSPQVSVVQEGMPLKIRFIADEVTGCNYQIDFINKDIRVDLLDGDVELETIIPDENIGFTCGMRMLQGLILPVSDLEEADLLEIENRVYNRNQ